MKLRVRDLRKIVTRAMDEAEHKVPIFKSSGEAQQFVSKLTPGDSVAEDVIDPETGEIYMEPGDVAKDPTVQPFRPKYIAVNGWNAYAYTTSFEKAYDVTKEELSAQLDEPEFVAAGDYDIGTIVPTEIKRPDGDPFTRDDVENLEEYIEWMNGTSPYGRPVPEEDRMLPPNMELWCSCREGDLVVRVHVMLK